MKLLVSLCFLSGAVTGFHVQPNAVGRTRVRVEGASDGSKQVDVSRARDCAENFGKCSVEEIKELRNELHQERIQNMVFTENPSAPPSDGMLDHRIIEEELELQLGLLESETPDPSLFPEDEEEMAALPHLKDGVKQHKGENPVLHAADELVHKGEDLVHKTEVMALGKESLLDEETMETMVICLAIAGLVFLPQLFHV